MRHRLDHPEDVEGCFGCKVLGLQMSPGDASSQKMVSNKKWDGELEAYRAARADGIQPAGTSMKKIQEARRASDVMGKAFDANTMGDSKIIQNKTVAGINVNAGNCSLDYKHFWTISPSTNWSSTNTLGNSGNPPNLTGPYASWVKGETNWVAPVNYPDDGNYYIWNEDALKWVIPNP